MCWQALERSLRRFSVLGGVDYEMGVPPRLLNLDRDAETALHSVPGLIVANWEERR
jgi:hypothetical protein